MRRTRLVAGSMIALALAACAPVTAPVRATQAIVEVAEQPQWRSIASSDDQDRLARINDAWQIALAEARAAGFAKSVAAEGDLLVAAAALDAPSPPPGTHRCRVVRLGGPGKEPAFNAFKSFFCYVEAEGNLLNITKQTGSQRPAGWLHPDDGGKRLVFIGTLALGDEEAQLAYGANAARDMVGVVERVAPYRYRLVVPWPRTAAKLDVIELVPAPPQ